MEGVALPVMRYARQEAWDAPVPVRGDVGALASMIASGRAVVLSGAGLSTDSGIPDYRGPTSRRRTHAPMTYEAFTLDPAARHRYWARSFVGWSQIADARPNAGHRAVAALERAGLLRGTITQNVDGLHQAAGTREVVELHGALDRVVCLDCGALTSRAELQRRLRLLNPEFETRASTVVNPDGDAELPADMVAAFVMTPCSSCEGPLKPDVVYFGESVPRPRVRHCLDLVEGARSLVVLGSSLTVMSGLRFVRAARREGVPVAIVATGPSRGDDAAEVRLDEPLGELLPGILATLGLDG
jgi:NAD-dependent SIR2 family protein deacetylase